MLSDNQGETARVKLAAGKGKATEQLPVVSSMVYDPLYNFPGEMKRHERHDL